MHIVNLIAENIKKLTAIDITPVDSMVMITGPNGAGKSSILDCIVMALCGGREIPAVPVKKGADKGKIIMDVGEFTITRSFTKDNSYLKIENKDGSNVTSPQKFLDKIVGNISFDPLDFLNNEKIKQRNILLTLLGINVDEIDKREKEIREKRTIIGRDVERYRAIWQGTAHYPEITVTEEVSISSLSEKLQEALEGNATIEAEKQANENLKTLAKKDLERIAEINIQIEKLTEERKTLEIYVAERKEQYVATKTRLNSAVIVDTDSIQTEIAQVEQTNVSIRANIKKRETKEEFDAASLQYDLYTEQITSISRERVNLLSNATMPVAGLSFDDTGLLYNGIPLDQASDGEKLMVSLAISMALNPTMKVLRIKDGSLLDEKNRTIIRDMVKEKDYQLWFESVGSDGKVGILIEEGEIVSMDGQPVKKSTKKQQVKSESKPESKSETIKPTTTTLPEEEAW